MLVGSILIAGLAAALLGLLVGIPALRLKGDYLAIITLGHSLSLGALGVFLLWFCWFGFNGCSTVSMEGDDVLVSAGLIFVTTNMAPAVASVVTMIYTWIRYKKPDVGMTLNAALAGLILTGLFSTSEGLLYGHGAHFLLIQCLGVACTALWAAVMITAVFQVIKHTIGLRVSQEEELKGLDITEHGLPSAYGGFAFVYDDTPDGLPIPMAPAAVSVRKAVPAPAETVQGGVKMTRVDILCKMERFDALKRAMFNIGITGMTAINVMGCGEQRGKTEGYFRGAKVEATMLPSIQVSIVVSKVPVSLVLDTARRVLYTGAYGDGKIFVYNVENVVKVRTGEQGYDALQDEESR